MQLIVQKKGYRLLPFLLLAVAAVLLMLVARDTQATHNSGQLELDGNTAYDLAGTPDGLGSDPGETNCPYTASTSTNAEDCIKTTSPATYDWSDDVGNVLGGDQGVCKAGASNLITEATPLKGDLRKCIRDFEVASTADVSYHTGSDKDYQEIWDGSAADWGCVKLNNATNKADLLNAYVLQVRPTSGADANHQVVFFGAERDFEHGAVYNGFWFLQKPISSDCPPSVDGDFCPDTSASDSAADGCTNPSLHTCGDVLILFNYDSGGRIGNIGAFEWVDDASDPGFDPADGCDQISSNNDDCTAAQLASSETHSTPNGVICSKTPAGLGDCRSAPTSFDDLCGRVNGTTTCTSTASNRDPLPPPCSGPGDVTTPWAPGCATPGTNCEGPLPSPTFSEAGADLTGLGLEIGCVAAFVAESRSSPSVDATLKDYAVGSFPACALAWEKRDESAGTAGNRPLQGGATFTITPNPLDGGSLVVTDCIVDGVVVLNCNAFFDKDPNAGQFSLPDVAPGNYQVCETTAPSGYAKDNSLCRTVSISAASPAESIGTQGTDDCTDGNADEQDFCNRLGTIEWEKRDGSTSAPHALQGGAQFSVSPNPFACRGGTAPGTFTDNAGPDVDTDGGQVKLERVCLGTYTITEETAPTGYAKDTDTTRTCTVSESALSCVVGAQSTDDHADGDDTGLDCSDSTLDPTGDECDFHNRLGSIQWEKRSDVDGSLQGGATFTVHQGATPANGDGNGPFACQDSTNTGADDNNPVTVVDDTDGVDNASGLGDLDGTPGQFKLGRVCLGTYIITETVPPTGFAADPDPTRSITVSASELDPVVGTQGTAQECPDSTAADTDEVDFCNLVGSLFWEKKGKDASTVAAGDELLPGFTFDVTGTNVSFLAIVDCIDTVTPIQCTAGAGLDQDPQAGQFCLDTMPIGVLLTINEASKATGYIQTTPASDGDLTITLNTSSKCSGTPTDAGDFINTPLSRFEIKFICLAPSPSNSANCATQAQIACLDSATTPNVVPAVDGGAGDTDPAEDGDADTSPTPTFDDLDEYFGNGTTSLLPGTYNCQIIIDP